ncbi:MAG: type III pantothenate kinase [Oscillospiraceae bacterium]|nr:type III pantothenate kinase [Oscillospiraceae bacterium]
MLLTIDIGNTNMVFGIFQEEKMVGSFRLSTKSTATSDEIGILAVAYFERFGYKTEDVKACIIASVVPQVMYSITSAIIKYFGVEPLVVGTDVDAGLQFDPRCYETGRLGVDRAVNCIAAIKKYGAPFIILDFGTATTLDAVNAENIYVGGTIGPGLRVSLDALVSKTAMLPRVELQMPETILGRNTVEQIQAGVVGGYVGDMEYLIRRAIRELGCEDVKVIATGGLSRLIAQETDLIAIVDSSLTMDGLRMIYDENRDAKPIEVKNDDE